MRDLVFIGSSRKDLKAFPEQARQRAGFGFYLAQIGEMDDKAVPMKGFGGASVVELRIDEDGDTYRGVYTVAFADAVYVLHCFQKKSTYGISTSQRDIELIRQRKRTRKPDEISRSGSVMNEKSEVYRGSGNVYADLGFADPELMLAKAKLAVQIRAIINARGLTQTEAADVLGVAQPDVSMITRGLLDNFSIERLMNLLLKFNQEIEITVRPAEHGARYIVTDPVATAAN